MGALGSCSESKSQERRCFCRRHQRPGWRAGPQDPSLAALLSRDSDGGGGGTGRRGISSSRGTRPGRVALEAALTSGAQLTRLRCLGLLSGVTVAELRIELPAEAGQGSMVALCHDASGHGAAAAGGELAAGSLLQKRGGGSAGGIVAEGREE